MKAPTTTNETENASNVSSSTERLPATTGGNIANTLNAAGQFARALSNPIVAVTVTAVVALMAMAYVVGRLA